MTFRKAFRAATLAATLAAACTRAKPVETITIYHVPTAHEDSAVTVQAARIVDSLVHLTPIVYEDDAPVQADSVATRLRAQYGTGTPEQVKANAYRLLAMGRTPSIGAVLRGEAQWRYGGDAQAKRDWQAAVAKLDAKKTFDALARSQPKLYLAFSENMYRSREDSLLAVAARAHDPAIISTFGCAHDLHDNVTTWNAEHQSPQYKLVEVWPQAFGSDHCDDMRATIPRADSIAHARGK